jgi:hypothetical protein
MSYVVDTDILSTTSPTAPNAIAACRHPERRLVQRRRRPGERQRADADPKDPASSEPSRFDIQPP